MRVAIVCDRPEDSLTHKPGWAADGFRALGHDVRFAHGIKAVREADGRCNLLILDHKAAGCCRVDLAAAAEDHRARWCYFWRDLVATDSKKPLAEQDYVKTFGRIMRAVDVCFVKERSLLPEYQELGVNAVWLDQACPENLAACAHPTNPPYDVVVAGSTDYEQRRRDVQALVAADFKVLWAAMGGSVPVPAGCDGTHWVPPMDLPSLFGRAAVVLGVDWRHDLAGYTSDRTYLACGAGACYVRRWTPEAVGLPCFDYHDHEQLVAIVRGLVANRSLRMDTGRIARKAVMANHTYRHRAEELLRHLPCSVA